MIRGGRAGPCEWVGLIHRAVEMALEIAVGTGKNLSYYPISCRITTVGMSPVILETAREWAEDAGHPVDLSVMDAEALAVPDHSFDTVASTLGMCTFPDPGAALREMGRVCRGTGASFCSNTGAATCCGWGE